MKDYFPYLALMIKEVQAITDDDDFYPTWKVTGYDGSGSWTWEREGGSVWVYATPWWDEGERDRIPVDLYTETYDDGLFHMDIPFALPTGDVKADAKRYFTAMKIWLGQITGV